MSAKIISDYAACNNFLGKLCKSKEYLADLPFSCVDSWSSEYEREIKSDNHKVTTRYMHTSYKKRWSKNIKRGLKAVIVLCARS